MFKYDEAKKHICACKVNKYESGPYCDGSHKRLDLANLPEAGWLRDEGSKAGLLGLDFLEPDSTSDYRMQNVNKFI